jgi:hypothetical protein
MPLIGFLNGRSRAETMTVMEHFRKGLADGGFVEGRNVRVEYRWADGRYDRLPTLATEIVDLRPTVIVATGGNVTALAAAAATSTIPIVFAAGAIRSRAALSRALTGRAAMRQGSHGSSPNSPRSVWSFCARSRPKRQRSAFSSIPAIQRALPKQGTWRLARPRWAWAPNS